MPNMQKDNFITEAHQVMTPEQRQEITNLLNKHNNKMKMYQITVKELNNPYALELTGDFWVNEGTEAEAIADAKNSYAEELNTTPENIAIIKIIEAIK